MEGNRRLRAYCAGGPSDRTEPAFSLEVKAVLDELGYETSHPQDDARLLEHYTKQGMTLARARQRIFERNLDAIKSSDVLLFRLDGRTADEGACVEAGIAYSHGIRCIGLQTGRDNVGASGVNMMIDGVLEYRVAVDLDGLRALLEEEHTVVDLRTSSDGAVTVDLRRVENPYVVISGPLGVGKTTLIELMGRVGNWTILPEPITENPYLADAYSNLSDLSFRMQTFYLGQRARHHQSARLITGPIVQERCLSEDGEVFTPALRDHGAYDDNDLETLVTLYRGLMVQTPVPDLVVYLSAPFEVTVERIRQRDRLGESAIDPSLLRLIYDRYGHWASTQSRIPLVEIDTVELDFVNRPEDVAEAMRRINMALTGVRINS